MSKTCNSRKSTETLVRVSKSCKSVAPIKASPGKSLNLALESKTAGHVYCANAVQREGLAHHIDFPLQDLASIFSRRGELLSLALHHLFELFWLCLPQFLVGFKDRVVLLK